jgi:hypothetical protein
MSLRENPEPVYNIEVEGNHCYRVGEQGLLVHNDPAGPCEKPPGQGRLQRGDINSNIAGGVPNGYQGHHLVSVAVANRFAVMQLAANLGPNAQPDMFAKTCERLP